MLRTSYEAIKEASGSKNYAIVPPNETAEDKATREKNLHKEHELEEEAQELVVHFNHRLVDRLLKCIRNTLDFIKRRVFPA